VQVRDEDVRFVGVLEFLEIAEAPEIVPEMHLSGGFDAR
jgi:hypothetical protein